jgi:hypothetical protein
LAKRGNKRPLSVTIANPLFWIAIGLAAVGLFALLGYGIIISRRNLPDHKEDV